MSNRVELLSRVNVSETNPFLLCNLLARRARQLASGQGVTLCTELINQAAREFVEGTLRYEVNGQNLQSARGGRGAAALKNQKASSPGAIREDENRERRPVAQDAGFATPVADKRLGTNRVSAAGGSRNE